MEKEEEIENLLEKLWENSTRLKVLIKAIPDIVYFKDVQGRNLLVNNAFEKLVGLKQEEIVGKTDEQFLPADLAAQCRRSDEEAIKKGIIMRTEEQTIDEKGEKKFFETIKAPIYDSQGKVIGIVGVSRDITERKIMEEKLRESEELFRSIVEGSHDGIAIVDENYRIAYANKELTRILGYPKEEIIGKDFRKFLAKESKTLFTDEDLRKQAEEWQKEKIMPLKYELKIVRKDGEKRDVEVKAITMLNVHGRIRTITQVLDVTERKKLEKERDFFEKRLSELNKYAQELNMVEDIQEIFRLTLDAMRKTLGFEYASVFMLEEKNLCLKAQRGYSKSPKLVLSLDGEVGITVRAARTGESINLPDVREDKAYVKTKDGILSELAVPMKIGNKVLGVLNVEGRRRAAFSEEDKKLLEILASHAATAISNLKRREKLAAINDYGRSLNKAKNMDEVCNLTLDAAQKILGFKHVSILLVEGAKLKQIDSRGVAYPLKLELPLNGNKGVTVKAVKTGKPIYVPDVRKEESYVKGAVEGVLSELAVPIKMGNKVLGVLNVESHKLAAFDEEDIKLLEILASHMATAITNISRQERLTLLSKRLAQMMESSTKIMQIKGTHKRLVAVAKTIQKLGWRKVVISLTNESLERKDIVAVGLTKEEIKLLKRKRMPPHVWKELFTSNFEKNKIGEFYYMPWNDPWNRKYFCEFLIDIPHFEQTSCTGGSEKLQGESTSWHPQDVLFIPLRTPNGRIVGIISMRYPLDGRKPTRESLIPLELFIHNAAIIIENAQLIESLEKAREQLKKYADELEQKVEERTRTLIEFQDKLLKAQRLAVIGELAGMVGHDLRNPLTSITGAAYYLKKRLAENCDKKIMEMIEIIEKNIAYSNKIINDLLDYSRDVKLDLTETTPKIIMEEAFSVVEIPENIQVVNKAKSTVRIKVDFEKMKRIFINLIKNAVEAMPNGGTLTVKSRKRGDKMEFTFSDTGVGMSEEVLKKLWTPLFTTKAKGMGFGLPVCKRFVEAHGGSIRAESTLGKGTTFTVTIPMEPKIEEGGENLWMKTQESSLLTTTKT
ncbi:MAG: GAF domain-containing protein [Candidatus Bathyarchaeia archaeon]